MIKHPTRNATIVSKGSWNHRDVTVMITIATILDKLTMLVIKSKVMKTKTAKTKNCGLYASKIPALVATALPPLNFKKMENEWPKILAKPKIKTR